MMITDVFVYGTLRHGQCRGGVWPRRPLAVRTAYVRGRLFDLGPYPAIRCDDDEIDFDWVAGEVWSFTADDMFETIEELDQIEETNQPGLANLYDRVLVRAYQQPESSQSILALAYQYSDQGALTDAARVHCGSERAYVVWPPEGING